MSFPGISPAALAFLRGLSVHNDRDWFAAHKQDYERSVRLPMVALLQDLAATMLGIDDQLVLDPRRGALSRIHRDTRFSRDKSPYRTNQWLGIKRAGEGWPSRPTFFFEFGCDKYRWGMGYYAASASTMAAVRQRMAARTEEFLSAVATADAAGFRLEGDRYARPRGDGAAPESIRAWQGMKSPYLAVTRKMDEAFHSPALAAEVAGGFQALAPLYRFLMAAG